MAKKEINEPKDANAILANISAWETELNATVDDPSLDDESDIKIVSDGIAAGAARQAEYFRSGRHEHPDSIISVWFPDRDRQACADFNAFFFGDEMIKKFSEWRRAQSFGLAPAERAKKIATLKAKIKAAWSEVSDLLDEQSDFPGKMPPESFLRWNDELKTCDHRRFVILHDRAERNQSANLTLVKTYEVLDDEKSRLQHNLRMMESSQLNFREDVEDLRQQIGEIDEKRKAAQLHRDEQSRAVAGSTALYGACIQFLRDRGIDARSTQFLLLGKRKTPKPYIDPLAEGYKARTAQRNSELNKG